MSKNLFIAEKPGVAREFANALKLNMRKFDGYMEADEAIVTWCVGHLITMSYPEVYDEKYRRWSFDTIPFIPDEFRYEVIDSVAKQFGIVSGLLNRPDVGTIYVCTDSGREGEYIYRLVEQMAGVKGKRRLRVWIDSQTEEEILRGIREARDLSEYDALSDAAYLRAKEDYLMGINFSRALTLKYGSAVKSYLKRDRAVISVGRVMTCVLGMIVNREREIRSFTKTSFYRVTGEFKIRDRSLSGEWKAVEGSAYYGSPALYKETGFKEKASAEKLIEFLQAEPVGNITVEEIERKKENKKPPLLYNLAELQNDCSKFFKISPDETLRIVQELYERKMITYPRTDARVLSTAVAKEIHKNLGGLRNYGPAGSFAAEILSQGGYKNLSKTRYVNDKQITDHYAIIPTGQGLGNLNGLPPLSAKVYEVIVRRFLGIFYPPAVYRKIALGINVKGERFGANFKVREEEGYLKVMTYSFKKDVKDTKDAAENNGAGSGVIENADADNGAAEEQLEEKCDAGMLELLLHLKKGDILEAAGYAIREGETSPPKRYTSGSIILTMENAGQFIEDEELRAQIKGSGIGTSATRAEILKKLVHIEYLALNKKTQVLTPTLMGEMIYDVVDSALKPLLNPALTASWEKGLTQVAEGRITSGEYMGKLSDFVSRRTNIVKQMNNQGNLYARFREAEQNYKKK
ncbi:MAG: DNA topoisomerase [Clostridium sp.]|nr:DNA topoisomerase [Acetatifactor muris]MCM1527113.1 DNA topoisomerase [Bacteroides sp.]MCM1563428.1 DNA topoisomerase [Clostridium sp.]